MKNVPASIIQELQRRPNQFGWTHGAAARPVTPTIQMSERINRDYMRDVAPRVATIYMMEDNIYKYAASRASTRGDDVALGREFAETVQNLKEPVALELVTSAGRQIAAIVSPEDDDKGDMLRAGFVHFMVRAKDGKLAMLPAALNVGLPDAETNIQLDAFVPLEKDETALYRGAGMLALNVLDVLQRNLLPVIRTDANPDHAATNRKRKSMNRPPLSPVVILDIENPFAYPAPPVEPPAPPPTSPAPAAKSARRAAPYESLAHRLQRGNASIVPELDPHDRDGVATRLAHEAGRFIGGAGAIYLVDRHVVDMSQYRVGNILATGTQHDGIEFFAESLAQLDRPAIIEREGDDGLRALTLIVPPGVAHEYDGFYSELNGTHRFYTLNETPDAPRSNAVLASHVGSFNPFTGESDVKTTIDDCFQVSGVKPADDAQRAGMRARMMNSLAILNMLYHQVDYVIPAKHHFGRENTVRARSRTKKPFSPVTTLYIDSAHEAVIAYHREKEAGQRAHPHASGYTYDRPFIVRPTAKAIHAKGGTAEQRRVLNEFLRTGDEVGLRAKLAEFDSPQAPDVVRVRKSRRATPES